MTQAEQPHRLLKLSEVMAMTSLGKTMIYREIKKGKFPEQFKPGGNASRWSEQEVQAWIANSRAPKAEKPTS